MGTKKDMERSGNNEPQQGKGRAIDQRMNEILRAAVYGKTIPVESKETRAELEANHEGGKRIPKGNAGSGTGGSNNMPRQTDMNKLIRETWRRQKGYGG